MKKSVEVQTVPTEEMQKINTHLPLQDCRCITLKAVDFHEVWVVEETSREAWTNFLIRYNHHMESRKHTLLPTTASLKPGRLVAVKIGSRWQRAVLQEVAGTCYKVFLGDYGEEKAVTKVWSLPPRFCDLPWQAIKIRIRGIEPQPTTSKAVAAAVMDNRRGKITNIGAARDGLVADLLLDRQPGQPPVDMAKHWLATNYPVADITPTGL
ncbi:uncharacterized protein LOC128885682 [Hylaeus anthracinus]|uniref:uncharacterized protein LOC128885682 n=1 Tax=Hylaeus anthracinus TaxID=313031 RepID=UPI0023BA2E7F|nr:uncharacterized protein LOC128885682 [Hylaeus anthracinus]